GCNNTNTVLGYWYWYWLVLVGTGNYYYMLNDMAFSTTVVPYHPSLEINDDMINFGIQALDNCSRRIERKKINLHHSDTNIVQSPIVTYR
ncbi:unnamed protein product, partial [Rotaria magnacalcarata]